MNSTNQTKNDYAAIYIRTSSEFQGTKSSPQEQENDCKEYAKENGFSVFGIYRDIEKYRDKGRLVEPSGTRIDRPNLLKMLTDGKNGKFSTIIAWREDRLYRGLRAMLLVLDAITEDNLDIMLVRESFDRKMAPVKAWLASMEIESMKERMSMGVKARLRAGKANTGQDRYGYVRVGDSIIAHPEE